MIWDLFLGWRGRECIGFPASSEPHSTGGLGFPSFPGRSGTGYIQKVDRHGCSLRFPVFRTALAQLKVLVLFRRARPLPMSRYICWKLFSPIPLLRAASSQFKVRESLSCQAFFKCRFSQNTWIFTPVAVFLRRRPGVAVSRCPLGVREVPGFSVLVSWCPGVPVSSGRSRGSWLFRSGVLWCPGVPVSSGRSRVSWLFRAGVPVSWCPGVLRALH